MKVWICICKGRLSAILGIQGKQVAIQSPQEGANHEKVTLFKLYVTDQDEAKRFYIDQLKAEA
jgi:hypothetical protein